MHVGRRSGAPALRRALALASGALALLLAFGSCSGEPTDASDSDLLELNRERDEVQLLGGQTGDGTGVAEGDEGREALDEPCSEGSLSRPLLQAEIAAEVGFSADDVLAWMQGGIESSLGWAPDGDLATRPEAGTGSVELRFAYEGAGIRLHTPDEVVTIEGRPYCSPWLEVDVSAILTTPGGAFAERFGATLRAARPRVVGFRGGFAAADLAGALELSSSRIGAELQSFEVVGTLTEHGSFGQVGALYLESVLLEADTVAAWPAPSECPPATPGTGVPIGDDARVIERSVADWKREFSELEVLPLTWSDGARTRLALDIQPTSPACYTTRWALPDESLRYGVQILALSEDGRWNGAYLGTARISRALPSEAYAALASKATLPPERAERLGVALPGDVELESLASLTFDLQLGRDVRADEALEGALRVTGSRELACFERPQDEVDTCLVASTPELTSARIGASD
jgi:hypothetical protein